MPTNSRSTSQSARRAQVASACESCRNSKVKCSGKHPVCARCQTRGTECRYDVMEEGMTKREHLRHELTGQKQELDRKSTILRVMQTGSDQEATELLARLRMGVSIDDMYEQLYGAADGESIDTAASSIASDDAGGTTLMEDIASDVAAGSSSRGDDAVDAPRRGSMQYGAARVSQERTALAGLPWDDYHLYHPLSTVSLADINRSPELSNIDPALQAPQQGTDADRSSSYDAGRGGF